MHWEITTHEFEIDAWETRVFDACGRDFDVDGADPELRPALVLIESLSNVPESFDVAVEAGDAEFETGATWGPARVLVGWVRGAATIAVKLSARVAGRFRISLMRLRKRLKQAFEQFPCDTCKSIAKILCRSMLAWIGVGMPPDLGSLAESLGSLAVADFFSKVKDSGLGKWIEAAGLAELAVLVLGPLYAAVKTAAVAEDWVYFEACRAAGACTDAG